MERDTDQELLSICTLHRGHTQAQFDEKHNRIEPKRTTFAETLKKACNFSSQCAKKCLQQKLPFIPFLTSYKFKSYFFRDLLSGICIGFMGVPQSLGYARIAKVPEIMGLYSSIFPVFIYFFFTSAKHVSIGAVAIISLVMRTTVETLSLPSDAMMSSANASMLNDTEFLESVRQADESAIIVFSASYCCAASLILILLSFFKLGFIASFMSEAFISAFLAANFIKINLYQLKDMLGLVGIKKHVGAFEFFFNFYEIAKESPNSNLVGVAMGVVSLNTLLFFKYYVNEKFKKKFKFPLPVEILVVVIAIFCNRVLKLEQQYSVEILTGIKPGLPALVLPSPSLMYQYAFDAFLCAIVAFLLVGMMAKLFAHKYGYEFNSDQEMFALGISGVLGCFFSILTPCTAPARCFLMESTGGKTQACHLFTAAFSLFTLLAFSSFMRDLPICVLAAIIISALIPLVKYFFDPIHFYKTNKYDLMIWVVTFCANMLFSVQEGMVVGITFSMVVVHVWMLKETRGGVLDKHSSGMFLDKELYLKDVSKGGQGVEKMMDEALQQRSIFIFKFEAPIFFSTLDLFKSLLFKQIPSPTMLKHEKTKSSKKSKITKTPLKVAEDQNGADSPGKQTINLESGVFLVNEDQSKLKCIILDFSAVTLMDTNSARFIAFLHLEYGKHGVVLMLAACNLCVSTLLGNVKECDDLAKRHVYPTVADAFIASFAIHQSSVCSSNDDDDDPAIM